MTRHKTRIEHFSGSNLVYEFLTLRQHYSVFVAVVVNLLLLQPFEEVRYEGLPQVIASETHESCSHRGEVEEDDMVPVLLIRGVETLIERPYVYLVKKTVRGNPWILLRERTCLLVGQ